MAVERAAGGTSLIDVLDRVEKVQRNLAGREAKREERAAPERPPRPWELGKRNGG